MTFSSQSCFPPSVTCHNMKPSVSRGYSLQRLLQQNLNHNFYVEFCRICQCQIKAVCVYWCPDCPSCSANALRMGKATWATWAAIEKCSINHNILARSRRYSFKDLTVLWHLSLQVLSNYLYKCVVCAELSLLSDCWGWTSLLLPRLPKLPSQC